jgi:hypothetical protein
MAWRFAVHFARQTSFLLPKPTDSMKTKNRHWPDGVEPGGNGSGWLEGMDVVGGDFGILGSRVLLDELARVRVGLVASRVPVFA